MLLVPPELEGELVDAAAARVGVRRQLRQAPAFAMPDGLYEEFCARFPYAETDDQLRAIDEVTEENGAVWMAEGSHVEPCYPAPRGTFGFGDRRLDGMYAVHHPSDPDEEKNELAKVASRYPKRCVELQPGDVVFFHGHVVHGSRRNVTEDRMRRAFATHYCSARSITPWGAHESGIFDPATFAANGGHILARGDTHLPFAQPKFGTPCAATVPQDEYPITVEIPVAWGDMDAFGHVNNTVFFRWFETARIAFLEAIDFTAGGEAGGTGPILASTSCRFRRPVTYPETVIVGVRVEEVGEDRFTHRYGVTRAGSDEVVASGEAVVVSYDYGAGRKAPIPAPVRAAVDRLGQPE